MSGLRKMTTGQMYDAPAPEVPQEPLRAHGSCHTLSPVSPSGLEAKDSIVRKLLLHAGSGLVGTPLFFSDYGWSITIGKNFYCNTGCVILDGAPVVIGGSILLAPNVHIYAAIRH